jgi:hypothetical protein
MNKLPLLISFLLVLLAACKKEASSNPFSNVTETSLYPVPVPSTAAGALYSVNNITYYYYGNILDTLTAANGSGWFGNKNNQASGGLVILDGDTMLDSISYGGYFDGFNNGPYQFSNIVSWNIEGNNANGIPAFSYTDNTPFPVITGLSIPAVVHASSGITLRYHISGAYDYVYYWLEGGEAPGKADITFLGDSSNTASFSTAQINQVIGTGSLVINVYVGKLTPYTIAGKTFYFVKQNIYQLNTEVQ